MCGMSRYFPRSLLEIVPFTFLMVIIPLTYWFEIWVVLPGLYEFESSPKTYSILFIIGHFLLMNVLGNCIGVIIMDSSIRGRVMPTLDSPSAAGYCDKCSAVTPRRAYHCPICNICILRRDHHCGFLGVCVGAINARYFLLFLFYLFLSVLLCMPYNIMFVWDFCTLQNSLAIAKVIFPAIMVFYGVNFTTEQIYLVICYVSVAGMVFVGAWFYFHLSLAISGKVVHEHRRNITLYDRGAIENLKELLGERWHLVWLSPFVRSPLIGDGVNFVEKNHAS